MTIAGRTYYKEIPIVSATQSEPFSVAGELTAIVVSTASANVTLRLQVYCNTNSTWLNTGLTHDVSGSAPTYITPETFAQYASGLAGHADVLRWSCSAPATFTIEMYSNIMRS